MVYLKRALQVLIFVAPVICCDGVTAAEPWIIDTHTHFKSAAQIKVEAKRTRRHPQDTLGKVIVPEDYRALADRLKIQATVVVEAVNQTDPQFNEWALAQAKSDLVCGYIARGDLSSPGINAIAQPGIYAGTVSAWMNCAITCGTTWRWRI